MTTTTLTQGDVSLLLESLDAMQHRTNVNNLWTAVFGAMAERSQHPEPDSKAAIAIYEQKLTLAKAASAKQTDEIILLRAKLVLLRRQLDSSDAEKIFSDER